MPVSRIGFMFSLGVCIATALQGEPPPAPGNVDHAGHGRVVRIEPATAEVVIAHDAIGGYMPAMTMPFQARDSNLLTELRPGDIIDFQLHVESDAAWIDHVTITGHLEQQLDVLPATVTRRELKEGETAPDIELVTSSNQRIRLSDFRGQPIAVTFVYTRCPLPTYCPLVNKNFATAQTLIRRIEPAAQYKLISITLDPAHDSPEVMKQILEQNNADRGHWDFASGSNDSVRQLGDAVGLEYRAAPNGAIDHNLRTVVLDRIGRVQKVFRGNAWTAQDLVAELIRNRG